MGRLPSFVSKRATMVKRKKEALYRSLALMAAGVGLIGLLSDSPSDYFPSRNLRALQVAKNPRGPYEVASLRGPYKEGLSALHGPRKAASNTRRQGEDKKAASNTRRQVQDKNGNKGQKKGVRNLQAGDTTTHDNMERRLPVYNATLDMCGFTPTMSAQEIPPDENRTNIIVIGYPGGDKRTVVRQMEGLTGLSSRDAWDFAFLGMTEQPFIKTNYPHHEGIWGWQDHGDKAVLVVRNIRRAIDEYHDILNDIDYAKTWSHATEMIPNLYQGTVNMDKYAIWRDERVMDEIGWYGWVIDYWMEGGLMRDYFDHKITTPEHFKLLREPETWNYGELQHDVNICSETIASDPLPLSYDPLCENDVSQGCEPVLILSAERLMDPVLGYEENRKIGRLLNETEGIRDYLVDGGEDAWDCFWETLILNNTAGEAPAQSLGYGDAGTGFHDYRFRQGTDERKHPVTTRMLTKMVAQLDRLINKYSNPGPDPDTGIIWAEKETAQYLVEILTEHRAEVQEDLDATPDADWPHAPYPHWVIFPICGPAQRGAWDYSY